MAVKDPNEVYTKSLNHDSAGAPAQENPKHIQAMKDGKAPLEYLVDFVMPGDAHVHQGGAKKYGYRNWTIDAIKASTYIASIRRHLNEWSEGLDKDPESGWSPLYHIRAACAIVLDADNVGKLIDDRDRAESISQEKEKTLAAPAKPSEQFIARFTTTEAAFDAIRIPVMRTYCYGPFADAATARKFVLENKHKIGDGAPSCTIDTILPIRSTPCLKQN